MIEIFGSGFSTVVLLFSGTCVVIVFHLLHLPSLVGFILTGCVIGPYGLGLVRDTGHIDSLNDVISVLLMFCIGADLPIEQIRRLGKRFIGMGFSQLVFTGAGVYVVARFGLGQSSTVAWVSAFVIPLSSTALALRILESEREVASPRGNVTLAVLLFQDFAFVPLLIVLSWLAASRAPSGKSAAVWFVFVFTTVGFFAGAARWCVPRIMELAARSKSRELFFFSVLSLGAAVAVGVNALGLTWGLGAFLAGLFIAESPYAKQAIADVMPLRDTFLSLFFLSIGLLLDLPFLFSHAAVLILVLSVIFVVKTICIYAVIRLGTRSHDVALRTSLLLFSIGEFSFVLIREAAERKLIDTELSQYLLALSVLSLLMTPFLNLFGRKFSAYGKHCSDKEKGGGVENEDGRVLVIGYGVVGEAVVSALKQKKHSYEILEMNYEAVKKLKASGEPALWGDATKSALLERAGVHSARLVIIAVSGTGVTLNILRTVRALNRSVRVLVRLQFVRELESLGSVDPNTEILVSESQTAAEAAQRVIKHVALTSC
jgi:CPA2 family monovalent cation:H+ antiporter-2